MTTLENNRNFQALDAAALVPQDYRAPEYVRAMRTLAQPAKRRDQSDEPGTTRAQRTAARFALRDLMARDALSSEQRQEVYAAFEHAFRHDDVAGSLLLAVRGTSLDFSQKYWTSVGTNAKPTVHDQAKRAEADRKRKERRQRNVDEYLAKNGSKPEGKKGKN